MITRMMNLQVSPTQSEGNSDAAGVNSFASRTEAATAQDAEGNPVAYASNGKEQANRTQSYRIASLEGTTNRSEAPETGTKPEQPTGESQTQFAGPLGLQTCPGGRSQGRSHRRSR